MQIKIPSDLRDPKKRAKKRKYRPRRKPSYIVNRRKKIKGINQKLRIINFKVKDLYRVPIGHRLLWTVEKSTVYSYWKYLNKQRQPKIIGIIHLDSGKFEKTLFGSKHFLLENVTQKKQVFHNSLIETALVSDCIYVFGPDVLNQHFKKQHGNSISVERKWKNKSRVVEVPIQYVSNKHVPPLGRKFIWFSFLYVVESFLKVGPLVPLKFFYHFGSVSVEVEKNLKLLRMANPLLSIFYSYKGQTSLTNQELKLPMLLSAADILLIRVPRTFPEINKKMINPLFIKLNAINNFSTLGGIFKYHKRRSSYIERRLIVTKKVQEN